MPWRCSCAQQLGQWRTTKQPSGRSSCQNWGFVYFPLLCFGLLFCSSFSPLLHIALHCFLVFFLCFALLSTLLVPASSLCFCFIFFFSFLNLLYVLLSPFSFSDSFNSSLFPCFPSVLGAVAVLSQCHEYLCIPLHCFLVFFLCFVFLSALLVLFPLLFYFFLTVFSFTLFSFS